MPSGLDVSVHSRKFESFDLVYPVISRRSGGLSLGVNLFPDSKHCTFDCAYCEVLPFEGTATFTPRRLATQLEAFLRAYEESLERGEGPFSNLALRDISISGNGEPTLSPYLGAALEVIKRIRSRYVSSRAAQVVLITNSTGFLKENTVSLLHEWQARMDLRIWAKLDAGTQAWFEQVSRSRYDLEALCAAIAHYAKSGPITLQTMLCAFENTVGPDEGEAVAYATRVNAMLQGGAQIDAIDFYTVARPCTWPGVEALSPDRIAEYAATVRQHLIKPLVLRCFDSTGQFDPDMPDSEPRDPGDRAHIDG